MLSPKHNETKPETKTKTKPNFEIGKMKCLAYRSLRYCRSNGTQLETIYRHIFMNIFRWRLVDCPRTFSLLPKSFVSRWRQLAARSFLLTVRSSQFGCRESSVLNFVAQATIWALCKDRGTNDL